MKKHVMQVSWFDDLTGKTCTPDTPGAFSAHREELPFDGAVLHRLTLSLKPGEVPRSLRIEWQMPHPSGSARCWNTDFMRGEHTITELLDPAFREKFAQEHGPVECGFRPGTTFHRWRGPGQAAEFVPGKRNGWYLAVPPENPDGILQYAYTREAFLVADTGRFIREGEPVVSELLEIAGCGDWRPPLGWFHDHYRDYFLPPDPRAAKLAGTFCITNPFSSDATLDDARANRVSLTELHNHYPVYGDFVPARKKWQSVVLHDYPELDFPRAYITPKKIDDLIDRLHERGIMVLFYFQCTGDCFLPFAKAHFPDDIAIAPDGKPYSAWKECCLVNALPGTAYARHIDDMLERLFARHPGIDGIFMDQLCYDLEDMAHDDGRTGLRNRPAANLRSSYYPAVEKAARMLHARGKLLWINGCFDLKVQRFADGVMAEGLSGVSEILRYFTLDKPLLVHQYPTTVAQAAGIFAYALRAGAPMISIGGSSRHVDAVLPPDAAAFYRKAMPLLRPLVGRQWCFLPRPVEFPEGTTGNVFRRAGNKGEFVVTIVSPDRLPPDAEETTAVLHLNLPNIRHARVRTFGQKEETAEIGRNGRLAVRHRGLTVILLD